MERKLNKPKDNSLTEQYGFVGNELEVYFLLFSKSKFFLCFFYATSEKYTINYINANKKIIKFQKSRKNKIK